MNLSEDVESSRLSQDTIDRVVEISRQAPGSCFDADTW